MRHELVVPQMPVEPILLPMHSLHTIRLSWKTTLQDSLRALFGLTPVIGLPLLRRLAKKYYGDRKGCFLVCFVVCFQFCIWASWHKHRRDVAESFNRAVLQSLNFFIFLTIVLFDQILARNSEAALDDLGHHRGQTLWTASPEVEVILASLQTGFGARLLRGRATSEDEHGCVSASEGRLLNIVSSINVVGSLLIIASALKIGASLVWAVYETTRVERDKPSWYICLVVIGAVPFGSIVAVRWCRLFWRLVESSRSLRMGIHQLLLSITLVKSDGMYWPEIVQWQFLGPSSQLELMRQHDVLRKLDMRNTADESMWKQVRRCVLLDLMAQSVVLDHCSCVVVLMLLSYIALTFLACAVNSSVGVITVLVGTPLIPLIYTLGLMLKASLLANELLSANQDVLQRIGDEGEPMDGPQELCGWIVTRTCCLACIPVLAACAFAIVCFTVSRR